jgi:excisionase family DNA binding protein
MAEEARASGDDGRTQVSCVYQALCVSTLDPMTNETTTRPLLTVAQVAERLNISRSAAYDLVRPHGGLPAVRIGRSVRVHPDALDEFVANGGDREVA